MSAVKVYEPCPYCEGQGWYLKPTQYGTGLPAVNLGPRLVCNWCGGTGKGKVKEIRDEQ